MTKQITFQYPEDFNKFLANIKEERVRNLVKDLIKNIPYRRLSDIIKKHGKIIDRKYKYYDDGGKEKRFLVKVDNYLVYIYYDEWHTLFDLQIVIARDVNIKSISTFETIYSIAKVNKTIGDKVETVLYEIWYSSDKGLLIEFTRYK